LNIKGKYNLSKDSQTSGAAKVEHSSTIDNINAPSSFETHRLIQQTTPLSLAPDIKSYKIAKKAETIDRSPEYLQLLKQEQMRG
jgi:hypothetical protein